MALRLPLAIVLSLLAPTCLASSCPDGINDGEVCSSETEKDEVQKLFLLQTDVTLRDRAVAAKEIAAATGDHKSETEHQEAHQETEHQETVHQQAGHPEQDHLEEQQEKDVADQAEKVSTHSSEHLIWNNLLVFGTK
jgi:hypothetical protein